MRTFPFILVVLAATLLPNVSIADALNQRKMTTAPPQELHYWYDGQTKRVISVNPSLIAEFEIPSKANGSGNIVKQVLPKASPHSERRGLNQLWLVPGTDAKTAITKLRKVSPTSRISEVLNDGRWASGRKRAIPGGLIIVLNPSWSEKQINEWIGRKGLRLIKTLNLGPNYIVVGSPSGLATLYLANQLYESGEVVSAFPDWWDDVVPQ